MAASIHDVIYLDFCKAFDSVVHNNLPCKLWSFGITGRLWQWLRSYLKDRHQCVKINNSNSDLLPLKSGVRAAYWSHFCFLSISMICHALCAVFCCFYVC